MAKQKRFAVTIDVPLCNRQSKVHFKHSLSKSTSDVADRMKDSIRTPIGRWTNRLAIATASLVCLAGCVGPGTQSSQRLAPSTPPPSSAPLGHTAFHDQPQWWCDRRRRMLLISKRWRPPRGLPASRLPARKHPVTVSTHQRFRALCCPPVSGDGAADRSRSLARRKPLPPTNCRHRRQRAPTRPRQATTSRRPTATHHQRQLLATTWQLHDASELRTASRNGRAERTDQSTGYGLRGSSILDSRVIAWQHGFGQSLRTGSIVCHDARSHAFAKPTWSSMVFPPGRAASCWAVRSIVTPV